MMTMRMFLQISAGLLPVTSMWYYSPGSCPPFPATDLFCFVSFVECDFPAQAGSAFVFAFPILGAVCFPILAELTGEVLRKEEQEEEVS